MIGGRASDWYEGVQVGLNNPAALWDATQQFGYDFFVEDFVILFSADSCLADRFGALGMIALNFTPGGKLGEAGKLGKLAKLADEVADAGKVAKGGTEVVQRAMSRAELKGIDKFGVLSRGGRAGDYFVSDAVNSTANRARQRLSLSSTPEVRVTLEVPSGIFSTPKKVAPKYNMPGGGMERTAPGNIDIPVRILDILEY